MRYRLFGPTGLRVSELFLGAMTFGEQGGVGAPPEECALILDTFADPRTRNTSIRLRSQLGSPPGVGWSCTFGGRHYACAGGRVPRHQLPRGLSGAFADVFRARDSPRHSPSYHLTTLIAGIESMGVRATSVGRAPGTRLVPAQPGYPGNGNRRCPSGSSS